MGLRRAAVKVEGWVSRLSFEQWAIIAIVLGAALLRLRDLGAESLWVDELTTLAQTSWGPGRVISESVVRGTPPLYYLLESALYHVLPASEWALRLLSAVADIVSVYLVYAVGRRLVGGKPALVASVLQALSIRALWFAQEARAYSLGMMLSLLVALTLLRLIESPGWRRAAVHAVVAIALLYTHVYSTFALIGIELAVLLSPRLLRRLGRFWWSAAGLTALAYVPWVLALVTQIGARSAAAEAGAWTISAPRGVVGPLITAVGEFAPGPYQMIPYKGPVGWPVTVFVALVFFGFLGSMWLPKGEPQAEEYVLAAWERRVLMLCWGGVMLVGGLAISQVVLPIYSWRMATQATPVIYLAAANGLRQVWRPAGVALALAFLLLSLAALRPYYIDEGGRHVFEKENWRAGVQAVSRTDGSVDDVLVSPSWHVGQMTRYANLLGLRLPKMTGFARQPSSRLTAEVLRAVANDDRVLVVTSHAKVGADGLTDLERALVTNGWSQSRSEDERYVRLRTYVKPGAP